MNCMEYFNKTNLNIIPQEDFENLTREVFQVIAENLSRSLGPLGSSATIFNGALIEATKDGYSILKNYTFNNRYKKMIYNLIKAPCTKMNNTVGDGTTTAITLTNAMYNRYQQQRGYFDSLYRLPRHFTKAWEEVIDEIIERVKGMSTPIDPEDYDTIYNIAYVVSNGNKEISSAIADTYRTAKSPAIKMKDSPSNKSYISPVNGFEFPTNAIDNCYVRNQDLTATETDVATIIFDHTIETDTFNNLIVHLNEVMRAKKKKLIVIAPAYDKYMCETVLPQYVNYEYNKYRELNLVLTQYNTGKLTPYQREDLAIILRSKTITQELAKGMIEEIEKSNVDTMVEKIEENPQYMFHRCIGTADSVLISCKNGCIFDVKNIEEDEYYQQAMERAQKELEDVLAHIDYEKQSFASKVYEARSRILQLEMKNFIYYVGADSELQKQILQGTIEDVIKCLRSATKHGVVPGCQLSIIKACREITSEINNKTESEEEIQYNKLKVSISNLIAISVTDVYSRVLHGPDYVGIIKTLPRWEFTTEDGVKALQVEARNKAENIIKESIERNEVFDLETLTFNPKIITSAETDTMVISAASELIKILISGNQCVFIDSDVTESHQDSMEVYV